MEWAEDSGNSILLKVEEKVRDEIDVVNDSLVGCAFGIPFGGPGYKGVCEIEVCCGPVACPRGVESVILVEGVFPVPGEVRDSSGFPDTLRNVYRLRCVFHVPGGFGVWPRGKQEVYTYKCRVLAAPLVNFLHVVLFTEVVSQGMAAHVARHDAADGLFFEVLHQECVELDEPFCGVWGHRLGGDAEGCGCVGRNIDVVHADPAPVFVDGDGIVSLFEGDDGDRLAPACGCGERQGL